MNWKGTRCLVTGSEGLIGKELVILLREKGAIVSVFDIKAGLDVTNNLDIRSIFEVVGPFDYVFHLFGIKGNPKMTKERPVDFMGPMLQGDTNFILAAQKYKVKHFLYTSSIAVENPESDKYPAWAKMTAETLIEAMRIQYPKGTSYCIVRPANCFGDEDINRDNLMVVSSLIKAGLKNNEIVIDIKGAKQTRDVIYSKDVARNMIKVMEDAPNYPVNLCSGKETKIKDIAEIIANKLDISIKYKDLNMILGPKKKVMKQNYKLDIQYNLKEAIEETIDGIQKRS